MEVSRLDYLMVWAGAVFIACWSSGIGWHDIHTFVEPLNMYLKDQQSSLDLSLFSDMKQAGDDAYRYLHEQSQSAVQSLWGR
jgi:hypothetical protein